MSLQKNISTLVQSFAIFNGQQQLIYQQIHMPHFRLSCSFCLPSPHFQTVLTTSLFEKYSTSSNFYFSKQIDDLIINACNQQVTAFHEILYNLENFEFMKREYARSEFTNKIMHFSEYYKFNRDIPRCFDKDLQRPLMRYQERVKKLDFRRVKNALKKEQGISITSQHSESSLEQSGGTPQSRYPSVLGQLRFNESSDSIALNNICDVIGNALGNNKFDKGFKGNFQEKGKNFAEFMEKERKNSLHHIRPRNTHHNIRQERNTFKLGAETSKQKHQMYQKKSSERNPGTGFRLKKDKIERVSAFEPLELNNFDKTLQQFYKFGSDKYQSIKSKNFIDLNKKSIGKSYRKSQSKVKTPNTTKISRQEKNAIDSERQRQDSKKVIRKASVTRLPLQNKPQKHNENNNAYLANQVQHSKEKRIKLERRSKSLSRSKSKTHLCKDRDIPSAHSSKKITRTPSNMTESSLTKTKILEKPIERPKQTNKVDRLLNKKLTVFLKY